MLEVIFCLNVLVAVGGVEGMTEPLTAEDQLQKIVVIQVDGAPKCLGAFVAPDGLDEEPKSRFIATAAHCVYGIQASRLEFTGLGKKSEASQRVKRVMVHPYYLPPSFDYDVALLRALEPQKSNGFLLNKDGHPSGSLMAVVWEKNKKTTSQTLATLEDRESCRKKMANRIVVSSRMLCAHSPPNFVIDGSPLFNVSQSNGFADGESKQHILGVGSYSPTGGSEGTPKIFTNIANPEISSFINKYIED